MARYARCALALPCFANRTGGGAVLVADKFSDVEIFGSRCTIYYIGVSPYLFLMNPIPNLCKIMEALIP